MSLQSIIEQEKISNGHIYLHKAGIFWKAYQYSAFLLLKKCQVAYQVKHRYAKVTKCDIFSVGFPESALCHLFKQEELKALDDKTIAISVDEAPNEEDYQKWVNSIVNADKIEPNVSVPTVANKQSVILKELEIFDLSISTPVDCLMLISKLQKELRE